MIRVNGGNTKKKLSGTDPNWFNHIFIALALCLKTRNKQNNSHLHLGIKICFDEIRCYFESKTLCLFAMSVQTKRLLIAFRHWHWHYKTKILTYIQIQDRHRNRPMSIRCAIDVVSYYESNHMSRVDHHDKHVLWNLQLQPQPLHAQMPFRVSLQPNEKKKKMNRLKKMFYFCIIMGESHKLDRWIERFVSLCLSKG